MSKKRDWIEKVSGYLLGIKKRSLDDYLGEFLRPDMPFDEIGILLFARMMHKHVVVFFNEIWWSTCSDNDYSKVDCYLIYQGKCKFCDTIPLTSEEWDSRKEYSTSFGEHYFETQDKLEKEFNANLHSTNEGEQADQDDSNEHSTKKDDNCTVQGRSLAVIGKLEKTDKEEEELLNEVESSFDVKVDRKKRTKKTVSGEPTCKSKRLQEQDDMLMGKIFSGPRLRNSTSSSTVSKPKPKPRTTRNSNKTAASVRASVYLMLPKRRENLT